MPVKRVDLEIYKQAKTIEIFCNYEKRSLAELIKGIFPEAKEVVIYENTGIDLNTVIMKIETDTETISRNFPYKQYEVGCDAKEIHSIISNLF